MFCIQTFLFEYDMVTSYMEGFSMLKCTTIVELFYIVISYHIYSSVYYLVLWKVKIDSNIYVYFESGASGFQCTASKIRTSLLADHCRPILE